MQIHFKYVLRKLFATFTHFSDVAILLSKLLVRLCKFCKSPLRRKNKATQRLFVLWGKLFQLFATVLKFCYRLPDAGHIVYQSSAPASISILSLGEVGLLSPCLTNIIVTKDSATNTVA